MSDVRFARVVPGTDFFLLAGIEFPNLPHKVCVTLDSIEATFQMRVAEVGGKPREGIGSCGCRKEGDASEYGSRETHGERECRETKDSNRWQEETETEQGGM